MTRNTVDYRFVKIRLDALQRGKGIKADVRHALTSQGREGSRSIKAKEADDTYEIPTLRTRLSRTPDGRTTLKVAPVTNWGAVYDCACRYAYAGESLSHLGSEAFSKGYCILWAYTLDVRNESTQAPAIAFLVCHGNEVRLQPVYARSRAITSLFRRPQ